MNQQGPDRDEYVEIDFRRLIDALLKKAWIVTIVSILCAVLTFFSTLYFVTPQYQSTAMFYVNNSDISVGSASLSLSSSDITASRGLVDTYIVILYTRETLDNVIEYTGVDLSYQQIKSMISAEALDETEVFQVTVTDPDPNRAEQIANAIADILPKRISGIVEGTSAKVVDPAVVPSSPSSPSYSRNTLIGFLLGFVLAAAVIVLQTLFDTTVRAEEDVTQVCPYPVLVSVPDMAAPGKGGYYGRENKPKKVSTSREPVLVGPGVSFSAAEAYKLLRTKLQFSFTDESNSRVIGISSALSGEGKSLTAVNLAYTLSELNKRVILIDCDMRRPTLAEKLGIPKKPGLSSYLTGQSHLVDLVQPCGFKDDEQAFHVIAAGQNPPNPVELLSSARMQRALEVMRKTYDYIILDLPPVGEVSDAMAVAKVTDGMLLVVRQNYCDRNAFGDAVRQFAFIDAKILGVVFNGITERSGRGYYRKYYKGYYRTGEAPRASSAGKSGNKVAK